MAFERVEFRKRTSFPERGTHDFRKGLQISLEAYDIALDYLITAMEQLRDSFRDMIEIQYGLAQYEEFLKDNRAAEKAKEMRPDTIERKGISEEDQKEDQRELGEVKQDQEQPVNIEEQQRQPVLRNPENQGWENPEEKKDVQSMLQDPEGYWEEKVDQPYDPDLVLELEGYSQQEEKRRGR